MFGNAFYRDFEYKLVTHARVFALIPNDFTLTNRTGLYIVSSFSYFSSIFSYSKMATFEKIRKLKITLPVQVDSVGEPVRERECRFHEEGYVPDWQYMEDYIRELEAERIRELEAYLQATGLKNTHLTPAEHATLTTTPLTRKFLLGQLFEYLKVTKAKKKNVRKVRNKEFNTPVVYAKFGDNGIMYWGRKGEFTTHSNVISIVYNGAIAAGKVYAQEEHTGILAESYLIKVRGNEKVPFRANLYMSSYIEKAIYKKYSRDNLATWNGRVENDTISLPVQVDSVGEPVRESECRFHEEGYVPDWEYMENYIRAIEKQTIKRVMADRDLFISTAKATTAQS